MTDRISRLRVRIDRIDDELLALVNRRAQLAREIGALKHRAPAYRPEREAVILRRIARANPGPLGRSGVGAIFRELISACRGLEQTSRVAYLGPQGTFSEMAVLRQFGHAVEAVPCASIEEVFRATETGECQFAVVPVENSTDGAVARSLDLLLATPQKICAEIVLRVHQNAMCGKTLLKSVRKVYSHAQSLAQCNGWLARNLPFAERVPVSSNAEAARRAATEAGACAIGPDIAAQRYGLKIVASSIEDIANNRTRFMVLGDVEPSPSGRDATSIVMSAPNRPGAVHALLTPLARHGVSMSRLESRPTRVGQWEYYFFADLIGHRSDPPVAKALAALRKIAPFLKVLGSYPVSAK
ncbi:MAG: prephenate dehydratase [Betaproteobacteria bacterium]|nr:prephenate dehydratase [Betaproteobacteria bacterium]